MNFLAPSYNFVDHLQARSFNCSAAGIPNSEGRPLQGGRIAGSILQGSESWPEYR